MPAGAARRHCARVARIAGYARSGERFSGGHLRDLFTRLAGRWNVDLARTGLPAGVARVEVRYSWSFTHTFIQFATDFVSTTGGTDGSYAGNFYFDPAGGGLRMWYMDQDNTITQGPIEISGGSINMRFSGPGKVAGVNGNVDFRVQVIQTTPDTYHWVLFANPQGNWETNTLARLRALGITPSRRAFAARLRGNGLAPSREGRLNCHPERSLAELRSASEVEGPRCHQLAKPGAYGETVKA